MEDLSQGSPAEAGIGAEAPQGDPAPAGTIRAPTSDESNTVPKLFSGPKSPGIYISPASESGENSTARDGASGGEMDPMMDDQLEVLSRIKMLQDELVDVERKARLHRTMKDIEKQWDDNIERFGVDRERSQWSSMQQFKSQSFVKDATSFAIGRQWAHESEDSFIWKMMERQECDKQLIQHRAQWEARKGIVRPTDEDKPNAQPTVVLAPHRSSAFPVTYLDPESDEARFSVTSEARGYDERERLYRERIHEVVRLKFDAFMRWKTRPPLNLPNMPGVNDKEAWPKPAIRYLEWKYFKFCSPSEAFISEAKKDLFAIDVLEGEPDAALPTRDAYDSLKRTMRGDSSDLLSACIPELAEGLVPERVRLNGPHFAQIFSDVGYTRVFESQRQIVLLQPYRLLIYYEGAIREQYGNLKQRLEEADAQKTAKTDDTHMEKDSANEHAKPPREGETDTGSGRKAPDATQQNVAKELLQQPEDKAVKVVNKPSYPLAETKTALTYLECLINFMDTTVTARRKFVQGVDCRKVHFKDLWHLFSPGDEVVRRDEKQVYRVIEVVNPTHFGLYKNPYAFDEKDTSRYFKISCIFVDFDGKRIGPVSTHFTIKAFSGEKLVDSLEVYPLRLHRYAATHDAKSLSTPSGAQTLRQSLIHRGRRFFQAACMKLENTFYNGPTADGDEVESQVVVDFETALSSDNIDESRFPQIKSMLEEADDGSSTTSIGDFPTVRCHTCCNGEYTLNDSFLEQSRKDDYIESLIPEDTYAKLPSVAIYPRHLDDTAGENALTDDEFLLMNYRVFAFILRTRKWGQLCFFVSAPPSLTECGVSPAEYLKHEGYPLSLGSSDVKNSKIIHDVFARVS
jgi:hypothetical protein